MRIFDGRRFYYNGVQQYGNTAPQGPGFITGPNGAPMFVPSGAAGWKQRATAEGVNAGGGSAGNTNPANIGGGSLNLGGGQGSTGSGVNIGGLNITGRDVVQALGSLGGGVLGSLAGPIGGLVGGLGGRLGAGALYDYLNPGTPATAAPAPTMEPTAEPTVAAFGGDPAAVGLGAGNLAGTQVGALSGMGSITGNPLDVGAPNIGGNITGGGVGSGGGPGVGPAGAPGGIDFSGIGGSPGINATAGPVGVGDITSGGMGGGLGADISGGDVNSGDPGEEVSGSDLHARGGRIRRRGRVPMGALSRRLGAMR